MGRSLRVAAYGVAMIGMASVLGACESGSPVGAEPASVTPKAEVPAAQSSVAEKRLQEAGLSGLKAGVNLNEPLQLDWVQRDLRSQTPVDFERSAAAPRFKVENARFGDARLSPEQVARFEAAGGEGRARLDVFQSGSGPEIAAHHIGLCWGSFVDSWFWGDYIDFFSWTCTSQPVTYIDVIGMSYAEGWYLTGQWYALNNASYIGVGWTYNAWLYGYYRWYSQYGDHWVENYDQYGGEVYHRTSSWHHWVW